jgi:hypothetical protein
MARTVSVVTVTGLVALAGPASAAPWTDVVPVSATMTASVVSPPVVTCGALKVGSVVLSWTAVPGATGYTLHYGSGGGTTEEVGSNVTSKSLSGLLGSGVFTVQTKITHGANTWTSVASNAKNYSILLFLVSTCTDA